LKCKGIVIYVEAVSSIKSARYIAEKKTLEDGAPTIPGRVPVSFLPMKIL
jgi:hypothetical protein